MNSLLTFQTPAAELEAHLGSSRPPLRSDEFLNPFVKDRFNHHTFSQSLYHHGIRDLTLWQENALRLLQHCLIIPKALGHPSSPRLLHRNESHPDYVVEELDISVTPPLRAPATVVIPRNGAQRHPAVVVLHSMGGFQLFGKEKLLSSPDDPEPLRRYRHTYYDGRSIQAELARAGFLSIAIDAINFGARTPLAHKMGMDTFSQWRKELTGEQVMEYQANARTNAELVLARTMLALGYSTAALVATDDLRTVDYLLARPDVDSDRIGCMGFSFGSFRTNYLAALDSRIKAAASVCWHSTLKGVISHNICGALGFFALPPGLYRHFDLVDLVALAAPKPFLAISSWQDPLFQPSSIAQAHQFYRQVWEQAYASERLGSLLFHTSHCFNTTMQTATLAFLQQHLGK